MIKRYWQSILFKVFTDLKIEAQTTYLGLFWWFIEPVFFLFLYYLVFGVILASKTPHFIEFLFIGLVVWRSFAAAMLKACSAIKSQIKWIREIPVSPFIFPLAVVLSELMKFMIIFLSLLLLLMFFHHQPSLLWLSILPNFICQCTLISGFALCCAAVTPFLPDFPQIVQTIVFSLMILSGVFFNILEVPTHLAYLLQWNPFADLLINYRLPLLYDQSPQWEYMLYTFTCGLLFNLIGVYFIRKYAGVFSRVIL